jgi:hypothetical protein
MARQCPLSIRSGKAFWLDNDLIPVSAFFGDDKPKILKGRRRFRLICPGHRYPALTSQKQPTDRFGGPISRVKRSAGQARQAT